jgi:hypothetical protein
MATAADHELSISDSRELVLWNASSAEDHQCEHDKRNCHRPCTTHEYKENVAVDATDAAAHHPQRTSLSHKRDSPNDQAYCDFDGIASG